jgi:hypothetical protein
MPRSFVLSVNRARTRQPRHSLRRLLDAGGPSFNFDSIAQDIKLDGLAD